MIKLPQLHIMDLDTFAIELCHNGIIDPNADPDLQILIAYSILTIRHNNLNVDISTFTKQNQVLLATTIQSMKNSFRKELRELGVSF